MSDILSKTSIQITLSWKNIETLIGIMIVENRINLAELTRLKVNQ